MYEKQTSDGEDLDTINKYLPSNISANSKNTTTKETPQSKKTDKELLDSFNINELANTDLNLEDSPKGNLFDESIDDEVNQIEDITVSELGLVEHLLESNDDDKIHKQICNTTKRVSETDASLTLDQKAEGDGDKMSSVDDTIFVQVEEGINDENFINVEKQIQNTKNPIEIENEMSYGNGIETNENSNHSETINNNGDILRNGSESEENKKRASESDELLILAQRAEEDIDKNYLVVGNDTIFVQVEENINDENFINQEKNIENTKDPIEIENEMSYGDRMETNENLNHSESIKNNGDNQKNGGEFEENKIKTSEIEHVYGQKYDKGIPIEKAAVAVIGTEPVSEIQREAVEDICIISDTKQVISEPVPDLLEAKDTNTNPNNTTNKIPQTETYFISNSTAEGLKTCIQCFLHCSVKFEFLKNDTKQYICSDNCLTIFKNEHPEICISNWKYKIKVRDLTSHRELSFERQCAMCNENINMQKIFVWEVMDFCSVACLVKYQTKICSHCFNCSGQVHPNSLSKYCVRFGNDIRQFCTNNCLEQFKNDLKICSCCHQQISVQSDEFLALINNEGKLKDFCSKLCGDKYDLLTNNRPPQVSSDIKCSVCGTDNRITIEFELNATFHYFCCEHCFIAFTFVNNIVCSKCSMCQRYFLNDVLKNYRTFYDNIQFRFCSNICRNIYIIAHRKIVSCVWCKVKKYDFDMIRYFNNESLLNVCSINCLNLYELSVDTHNSRTTMPEAIVHDICSYDGVTFFQNQSTISPVVVTGNSINDNTTITYTVTDDTPEKNRTHNKRNKTGANKSNIDNNDMITIQPILDNVESYDSDNISNDNIIPATEYVNNNISRASKNNPTANNDNNLINSSVVETPVRVKEHILIRPAPIQDQRNVSTMCKVRTLNKFTNTTKFSEDKDTQTDENQDRSTFIPVPVPVYVPVPVHMYTAPLPIPLPIPIPIPVPLFIPTTRNSTKGIMKEIRNIKIAKPADPLEAELLMIAEIIASDKKEENTDSESEVDNKDAGDCVSDLSLKAGDVNNSFGDDVLEMALNVISELDESVMDLDNVLAANTVIVEEASEINIEESIHNSNQINIIEEQPKTKRKRSHADGRQCTAIKKYIPLTDVNMQIIQPVLPLPPPENIHKSDVHLRLKYTFGVNAWKQWVAKKNDRLKKVSKYSKLFKTEILHLTGNELNYYLCLFVEEVRKPNGVEYAPDTLYYLCLGIQQYLFENSRIDNIFFDPYYEDFTDNFNEVACNFSKIYADSHYIVTRIEEEHLWECKQLGPYSPYVLLNTLMFFNTKYFNLTSIEEHRNLSFSNIIKHFTGKKQNRNSRSEDSRTTLIKYYPPKQSIENNAHKKLYEQRENKENPFRCPVKLYEFYLSKCSEIVKTRNDVFYLQPERSSLPDSPVWYSTTPLPQKAFEKMLNRIKMVKEINEAFLNNT